MSDVERPPTVVIAVLLIVASLLLGLVKITFVPIPGPFWVALATIGVMLGLTIAIWFRQNWARWIFSVLFIIGLPMLFLIRDFLAQQGMLSAVVLLAQTIAQAAAVGLLFAPRSSLWYRKSGGSGSRSLT